MIKFNFLISVASLLITSICTWNPALFVAAVVGGVVGFVILTKAGA